MDATHIIPLGAAVTIGRSCGLSFVGVPLPPCLADVGDADWGKLAVAIHLHGTHGGIWQAQCKRGDLLVRRRGPYDLDRRGGRLSLRRRRGGLSVDEMLNPWLAVRLGA
jgi:hypothetical protein